ncbi:MAG: hypothetical protein HETSPECPRED_005029 [Heterodermia speciosa]|uniref:Uncharacterized protein n=1 Tax=Heterodermia speciosa TaxID=116794 RepID=A0A8H3FER7_9LECA|nr:MAG: hypothetical protein HETSPECPRED_005029 [Heterodermia speciosa]
MSNQQQPAGQPIMFDIKTPADYSGAPSTSTTSTSATNPAGSHAYRRIQFVNRTAADYENSYVVSSDTKKTPRL